MKYLKKFNEELRPQTYRSAARKLDKLGHTDRAQALKDWALETEKKEEMIKWKDSIQDYAQFGTFKMAIKNEETGKTLTGDFHLDINFDAVDINEPVYEEPESIVETKTKKIKIKKEVAEKPKKIKIIKKVVNENK